MTFKYSICHPNQENIAYRDDPISDKEVMDIAENYPWIEQLNLIDSLDEVHYSPSLDFTCLENNRRFCLTAAYDKERKLEFSLWYCRPKKVKVLFGLFGESERTVVDDVWSFSFQDALKYLDYFVNGNYHVVEGLYKK